MAESEDKLPITNTQELIEECHVVGELAGSTHFECDDCGRLESEESGYSQIDRCEDCGTLCDCCEDAVPISETYHVIGEGEWCERCLQDSAVTCIACNDYHHCEYVSMCASCDEDYCHDCMAEHGGECESGGLIHEYGYKPRPQFMGRGPRYFGVELEIDGAGASAENAEAVLAHSKDEALFYLKHDSSLEAGFEIVTHPMSFDYHMNSFPWEAIADTAIGLGYTSHDAKTCGLHVHVSRKAIGKSAEDKLLLLMWLHWEQIFKFSRRENDGWCRQQYTYDKACVAGLMDAKQKGHSVALNTEHAETLEFRIFRGSLNTHTIRAAISFVNTLVNIAKYHGIIWVYKSKWSDILKECKADKNLWMYLENKRLTS